MIVEVLANKEPLTLQNEGHLMVVIPDSDINLKVPSYYVIDPQNTLKVTEELTERSWKHISQGPLFPHFWSILFKDQNAEIPETYEDLVDSSETIRHSAGLIIRLVEEGVIAKKNLYLKFPETYMHPKAERCIISLLNAALPHTRHRLLGGAYNEINKAADDTDSRTDPGT